ncbi:uncharacterized protein [Prorops nasuta]|uniref:uncharacterized protein n=1 Tax=Prorops nasuta TaxID=863751 RepID=UPI0034CD51C3
MELKKDPAQFYRYTRMSLNHFHNLLELTKPYLEKSHWRALNAELKLLIAIRYLATGDLPNSIALAFRIGESTVRKIIKEVCAAIISALQNKYLPEPNKEHWKSCGIGFWNKWNLPNCVGAIDGKHIRLRAPPNSGSLYYNYKKYFSIVLMAIADHLYRFSLVDIGAFGGMNDAGIFHDSNIGINLNNEDLHLPKGQVHLPNSNLKTSHYFVADDAFKLSQRIVKPYSKRNLSYDEKIFNYRISRARRTVESAFGIFSNKWRIFHTAITILPDTADLIVSASVCLHNYILKEEQKIGSKSYYNSELNYFPNENAPWMSIPDENLSTSVQSNVMAGEQQRAVLLNFFKSPEGQVEWQHEFVQRGIYADS